MQGVRGFIKGEEKIKRCSNCGKEAESLVLFRAKTCGRSEEIELCVYCINEVGKETMKEEIKLCSSCGKGRAEELSPCPYAEEIAGKIEMCDCCGECLQKCLDAI